jgi:hypothetical protein
MNDLKFGKAMGTTTGGVVSYSSDYKTVNNNEYMTRHDFHSYVDGIYLGYILLKCFFLMILFT